MHFTFNYEHFPESINRFWTFTESDSIYASDEIVVVPHSVCSDIEHSEIGQFVKSLFKNNCVDIYSILTKTVIWINENYFSIYIIVDTY